MVVSTEQSIKGWPSFRAKLKKKNETVALYIFLFSLVSILPNSSYCSLGR